MLGIFIANVEIVYARLFKKNLAKQQKKTRLNKNKHHK